MTTPSIVFICSRLDLPGGTEKAIANTANLLSLQGHPVSILILDETPNLFFSVLPTVKIKHAPLHFGITTKGNAVTRKIALIDHVKQLRKLLANINADIIISTEYHFSIAAYLAAKNTNAKIFSWEHHHYYELKKNKFWNFLFHRYYQNLDGVVCLNKQEAELFEQVKAKPIVIPNFVEQKTIRAEGKKTLLTVARLSYVKGIDMLLEVMQVVAILHPDWQWKLIGDGEQFEDVSELIKQHNLQEFFILQKPSSQNIEQEYLAADVYVMTSRNECFPMVLLEAMSYGIPCIAFDCDTGPRHIITSNKDGILVEEGEVAEMIEAIRFCILNEETKTRMGDEAFKKAALFSPEKIYQMWQQLFQSKIET